MGTLQTVVTRALVRSRSHNQHVWAEQDDQLLGLVNGILEDINKDLRQVESSMAYSHGTITTESGTMEYTPLFTHVGFCDDGVWINDDTSFLKLLNEADKVAYDYLNTTMQPEGYFFTEDSKVGFLWVPDDVYTVNVLYWKPLTEMTTIATDTLPFMGIWNRFIQERLTMDLMMIEERDITQQAAIVANAYDAAMSETYRYGVRNRRISTSFFDLEGT